MHIYHDIICAHKRGTWLTSLFVWGDFSESWPQQFTWEVPVTMARCRISSCMGISCWGWETPNRTWRKSTFSLLICPKPIVPTIKMLDWTCKKSLDIKMFKQFVNEQECRKVSQTRALFGIHNLALDSTKNRSVSTWNVRSLEPLVFLLMQSFEGHKTVGLFLGTWQTQSEKFWSTVKALFHNWFAFSHMRELFFIKLPHTPAPSWVFPTASFHFFPKSKSWELLAGLKSYNLDLLKILAHLAQLLRSCKSLGEVSFLQDDGPEERPGFGVARLWRNKYSCNISYLPWKSSRPNNSKVAGLERIIHVVKDSTNLPVRGKFGPNLDFLGFTYNNSCHTRSGGVALQRVRC